MKKNCLFVVRAKRSIKKSVGELSSPTSAASGGSRRLSGGSGKLSSSLREKAKGIKNRLTGGTTTPNVSSKSKGFFSMSGKVTSEMVSAAGKEHLEIDESSAVPVFPVAESSQGADVEGTSAHETIDILVAQVSSGLEDESFDLDVHPPPSPDHA